MRSFKTIALAAVFAAAVFAQNDRGTITGTVSDQAGAVIPNASITAVNVEVGNESKTNTTATGNYTIPSLVVGRYRITIEVTGFKKFTQENILVQVATTNRIDVTMQIGATSDTVTVTSESAVLKTETAEQSTIITGATINELPLNFGGGGGGTGNIRNPYLFNILSPGVANNALGQGDTANVNGLPASTFRVQVDGQDATTTRAGPPPWPRLPWKWCRNSRSRPAIMRLSSARLAVASTTSPPNPAPTRSTVQSMSTSPTKRWIPAAPTRT